MFNKSGVTKVTGAAPKQILAFPSAKFAAVGIVVDDAIVAEADANGKKIALAGTPLYGNLDARATAFVAPTVLNIKGAYEFQIATAATANDTLIIENVVYTCGAAENVGNKVFAGADAAAQIVSLLKMVVCDDFVVAAGSATDKLKFTQKVADTGNLPHVAAVQAGGGALVIGQVVTITKAVETEAGSNAVGVLLHDVDVTAGDANGTLLIEGYVNTNRLAAATAALLIPEVRAALKGRVDFIAV